ncbi:hypothetical protein TBS_32150 [Thermobispora bispora]
MAQNGRACRGQGAARSRTTLTISTFHVQARYPARWKPAFRSGDQGGVSGPATVSASRHAAPSGDRPAERIGDRGSGSAYERERIRNKVRVHEKRPGWLPGLSRYVRGSPGGCQTILPDQFFSAAW